MPAKAVLPPETREILLDEIQRADAPVPAAPLAGLPGLPRKMAVSKVKTLLAGDVSAGRIFEWGKGKTLAYWSRDPRPVARERLLALAAREVLSARVLEQRAAAEVPAIDGKVVKAARAELVGERHLQEMTVAGRRGKVVLDREHLRAHLEAAITRTLAAFGVERPVSRIRALLAEGAEIAGDVREVAEQMFAAMNRIASGEGTSVTFQRLRAQPELSDTPKKIFDEAALLLQKERRALLSVHDHATGLPPEERERFVTDGLGTYYVSIYKR